MCKELLATIGKVFIFSLPIIINLFLRFLPTITSMWILSRLGKDYIAAAGIAAPTFYTIMTFFISGFNAVGVKVANSFGKNKINREISIWVTNAIILGFVSCTFAIIALLNIDIFLLFLKQDPYLITLSKPFFTFGALAIIPIIFNTILNQYFIGIGHTKVSLALSTISCPLIVILSYGLVLGKWGLPKLAMGGINCATSIVGTLILVIAIFIAIFIKWSKPFHLFSKPFSVDHKHCVELLELGWPIGLQNTAEMAVTTIVTYLLGIFGISALAAAQITQQYTFILFLICVGLSSGVSILVSKAYGENNFKQIKYLTLASIIIISIVSFLFAIAFLVFPTTLVDLYLDIKHPAHSQLVYFAVHFMIIVAIYAIFNSIRKISAATLQGMQDAKTPMKTSILCMWGIGLPCAYIAGFLLHGGPIALRSGFIIGVIIASCITALRCKKKIASLL